MTTGEVSAGLRQLADERHVVLGEDGEIVMAHPFSAITLGFSVMGERHLWWGGCAWDSFALPHVLPAVSREILGAGAGTADAGERRRALRTAFDAALTGVRAAIGRRSGQL